MISPLQRNIYDVLQVISRISIRHVGKLFVKSDREHDDYKGKRELKYDQSFSKTGASKQFYISQVF